MTILAVILTMILVTIAALHTAWGIGFWIPIRDEASLARAVVGAPGRQTMPGAAACSIVAVALLGAASVLWWTPGIVRDLALWVVGGVLVLRGIAAWSPAWRRSVPVEPFATLDRRCYRPLCLVLGIGFWLIAV